MTIEGEALLVRIYIGESDHVDGKPAYDVIVRLLRERGIRGASVFRGLEGYGRSSRVHTTRILALSEDLPILIEAVDEAHERIALAERHEERAHRGIEPRGHVELGALSGEAGRLVDDDELGVAVEEARRIERARAARRGAAGCGSCCRADRWDRRGNRATARTGAHGRRSRERDARTARRSRTDPGTDSRRAAAHNGAAAAPIAATDRRNRSAGCGTTPGRSAKRVGP